MNFFSVKSAVAKALDAVGILELLCAYRRKSDRGTIRVLNYHGTHAANRPLFEAQLEYFEKHYANSSPEELQDLLAGNAIRSKPGLILSFDDGLENNADVAAPLLESHGFKGWFFVPSRFPTLPAETHRAFARKQMIGLDKHEEEADEKQGLAMSVEQTRKLAATHVVGCHTRNHTRLNATLPAAQLEEEIVASKAELEALTTKNVFAFAWVGGQEADYSHAAAQVIHKAGYTLSFMTNSKPVTARTQHLQIQRTHIESSWDMSLVKLQLSGLIDLVYRSKRQRVNQLTACHDASE